MEDYVPGEERIRKLKTIEISSAYNVEVKEIETPKIKHNEILLEIKYIGLCGSDLSSYRGLSSMVKYPVIPGHEIAAVVTEIGAGVPVDYAKVGDQATVLPYFECGQCTSCRKGRSNACRYNETLGVQRQGALSRFISIPYEHVIICNGIPIQNVALIEPLSVGFHLSARMNIQKGENVAVFGCGVIGLGAIAAASFKGARVLAVDVSETKLQVAKTMGAAEGVDANHAVESIFALTNDDGADTVVECSGAPIAFVDCLNAVSFSGKMGVISYTTKDITFNTKTIVSKELNILGSRNAMKKDFTDVIGMIREGTIPVETLITKVFDFDDGHKSFEYWENNVSQITKILIKVS